MCREIERQIADAYLSNDTETKEVISLLELFRNTAQLTVEQLCKGLGINAATYSRWKNRPTLPPKLPHKLQTFLSSSETDTRPFASQSVILDGVRVNLLGMNDILGRHHYSKEVWVFKHLMPFKAGMEGRIRHMMLEAMVDNQTQFHFVFYGDLKSKSALAHPAQHSFSQFKEAYCRQNYNATTSINLHGYLIDSASEAFELGIPSNFNGMVLDIYDPIRREESSTFSNRDFDIFTEIVAATYDPQDPTKMVGEEIRLWVELPPKRKMMFFRKFLKVREKIILSEVFSDPNSTFPDPPDDIDLIY